ncbi:MAG TPA: sugar-binding protein [Pyrinomonadaceae bacterium]|nr:sugar-binding protein [Acidobacteriota bacterium]HQZ97451.1 sugar-binding protein [Pyrinomonadaceae bacterium]HRA41857.1 sugar-binding protein [Pyrinomonadaceae bacterium]
MNNRILTVCSFLLGASLLASCGGGANTTSNAGANAANATAAGKEIKLAFVTNNASDYWTIARKGVEKADGELNDVKVEFKLPGEGTAAEQKRIIDDLTSTGIQGIAISPVDPDNQTQLINDTAKKALVITQDSDAPTSDRALYIGTDNVAAGRQAGELVKEALPNGGKIMVFVGKSDARNAAERFQGLKEALKDSKVEIIDIRTDDTDRARAKTNAADTLTKYPDIAGMVGLWSYNGPAILNAVKDAGKLDKVKIICFDEEDETLAGVKEGSIFATVVQQPYEFGYQSVILMSKIIKGDKSVIPAGKQINVPTLVIKKDSVEEFTKKINGLRGR